MNAKRTHPSDDYLHGYCDIETKRLYDQAKFVYFLSHKDLPFERRLKLLEVGSGVGAQTALLLNDYPHVQVSCIDINDDQIEFAQKYLKTVHWAVWPDGTPRYELLNMDGAQMEFEDKTFDGAFLCYVLEHAKNPLNILKEVKRVLEPGAPISCYEVIDFTTYFHPHLPNFDQYWKAMKRLQSRHDGDGNIGVRLGHLLKQAGFNNIKTDVRTFHHDSRDTDLMHEFIIFFKRMLLSASERLLDQQEVSEEVFFSMLKELDSIETNPESAILYFNMHAIGYA